MELRISLVLLALAAAEAALPLPPYMTKCTTTERAALNACATENARRTVATIAATGDRKYGISPFDPVFIPQLVVEQSGLFLVLTNATMYTDPPGSWFIHDVDVDLDKRIIKFLFSSSAVILKSNYRVEGRILAFDLKGSGDCEIKLDNFTGLDYINYDVVKNEKDGLQYVKIKNIEVNTNVTKSTFKFNNLFQGQEALSRAIHDLANENWEAIWEDTKDSVMEAFGEIVKSVMQSCLNFVPYQNVFPE